MNKSKMFLFLNKTLEEQEKITYPKSGGGFEDMIAGQLKKAGLTRAMPNKNIRLKNVLQELKPLFIDKEGVGVLENETNFNNIFISQPYGSQSFPDFVVFLDNKVFAIEVKFINGNSNTPFWNGHLPRRDTIYIFGQHQKQRATFFLGQSIISDEERSEILKTNDLMSELFKRMKKVTKNGFQLYHRQTFQQDQTYDYFENAEKNEKEVYKLIKKPFN